MVENKKIREILSSKTNKSICILYSLFFSVTVLISILNILISKSPVKLLLLTILYLGIDGILCIGLWITYISAGRKKISKGGITLLQIYAITEGLLFMLLWGGLTVSIGVGGIMGSAFANLAESSLVMTASMLMIVCGVAIGVGLVLMTGISMSGIISLLDAIKHHDKEKKKVCFTLIRVVIFFNMLLAFGLIVHQLAGMISQITLKGFAKVLMSETNLIGIFEVRTKPIPIVVIVNILGMIRPVFSFIYWIFVFRIITFTKNELGMEKLSEVRDIVSVARKEMKNVQDIADNSFEMADEKENNSLDSDDDWKYEELEALKMGSITCIRGKDENMTYPLADGEEIIIGKDPLVSSIIVNQDYKQISRKHCGIRYNAKKDAYMVIDYSTNGTFVNGKRLTKEMYATLSKGDIIGLSKEELEYRLD